MLESKIKVMFLWVILSSVTFASSQLLNKDDCGKNISCYSEPPSCKSSQDCEYLLKYSVNASGQDVVFELSSNKYQWMAVGFNPNAKSMAGGESLACETYGSKVELHHYDMPRRGRPYPSNDTNATLLSSNISANILSCKIQRKLDLEVINRYNLSNPFYFLYAAGNMKGTGDKIDFHKYFQPAQSLLSIFTISDNTELPNKDDCGKTKSCYSEPASCKSTQDCKYLLKYSVTATGQDVVFELSSNKYQWMAVGFNPKAKSMAGGESLSCEIHGDTTVLNHYNMPEKGRPHPSSEVNATLLSSNISGNIHYCKIQRKLDLGVIKRYNLRNPFYFLYAAGNVDGDKIHFHKFYEPSQSRVSVSTISDNTDTSVAEKRIDSSQCGKTLGCSRIPSGCHDNTDCDFLVAFTKNNGTNVEFSVSGKSDGWIAIGFNDKSKMGGTDTVICQPSGVNNVTLSVANLHYSSPHLENSNEIKFLEGVYEGGVIYCKFSRPLKAKSSKRLSIDVSRYVIYGKGSGKTKVHKHKHDDRGCSNKKVDFGNNILFDLGVCGAGGLEKVHGSFMIFAWMFLAIISIFIARYSRLLWKGWRIRGSDAWFQFHRLMMGLAVVMTIIAIIIIFVDKEGWSESAGDHAIFGIIVLVLTIIQPTIAFFRPHPNGQRRPIFNWFHRIVALILVIFVVVTMFKGADLLEDSGGDTVGKVIIALIVIAIITALILEYLAIRLRKKKPVDTNLTTEQMQEEKYDVSEFCWEIKVQRILLVLFALLIFILAVVMIAYVAGAGSEDDDDDDDHDDDHDD